MAKRLQYPISKTVRIDNVIDERVKNTDAYKRGEQYAVVLRLLIEAGLRRGL